MSKKEDKHIKYVLSKIEANKAPADFTNKVMKDVIMMSSSEEALKSAALTSLLNQTIAEKPSQDFTAMVMGQIEDQKAKAYEPLISRNAWTIISAAVVTMLLFLFLSDAPNESSSIFDSVLPYLEQTKFAFTNPFKNVTFSPLLTISLICLSSMLFFDTLLKRKLFV